MDRRARTSFFDRLGRGAGGAWRFYVRREAGLLIWLNRLGLSLGLAKGFLWFVKLIALGALLYAAFWVALVLLCIIVAARGVMELEPELDEEEQPQWRNGLSGYGLYRGGTRIDLGSTDDD